MTQPATALLMKFRRVSVLAAFAALVFAMVSFQTAAKGKKGKKDDDTALTMVDGIASDIVDVRVVNIDTYVTDKKGNRITGLEASDFEVLQDGQPLPITNFYVVEEGEVLAGGLDVETIEVPEYQLDEPSPVPESQQLSLVVYVDNYNLHPFSRNRSFRFIRTFLRENVRRGDRVMLMSYDRELHERQPFTRDSEIISAALYDLEDISAHALHRDSDRRDLLQAMNEERVDFLSLRSRIQTYAENQFNDLSFSLRALSDLVEQLAGLPGRKAVLYISDGLALRAGEDLYHALDQKFPQNGLILESFRYDLTRDFQRLTTKANSNRVSFYALDAEGLRTYQYYDARNATAGGGTFVDQTHFRNLQSSLQLLAEETGGFAMINTNDFTRHLARMGDDFKSYYSLGVSPATNGTGRYRRLEVRVKGRKGLVVRHREGYRDKAMSTRMNDSTLAALFHGYRKNPLGLSVEVQSMARREDGNYDVALAIKLPIGSLALLPQSEFHRGKVLFYIAARDSDGGVSEVQSVPLDIDIPVAQVEEAAKQFYRYEISLMMRAGNQMVAVGMRDEIGAETSFVAHGVTVGG